MAVAGPDRDIAEVLVPESGDEPLLRPEPLADLLQPLYQAGKRVLFESKVIGTMKSPKA